MHFICFFTNAKVMQNIKHYTDIGQVRYVKNNKARNLSIRINPQGDIRVTIPRYLSLRKAESFLFSKRGWILKKQKELKAKARSAKPVREGDFLEVRGKQIRIVLENQLDRVEEAVWRILLREGKGYLPGRVAELAEEHGFKITGVKIRRMKTRWGSCSNKNGINLNSWLVMLPDYLSDYVILHELVHTRQKDHSPRFWEMLDQLNGGQSKRLRKELRSQSIMLINTEDQLGGQVE